MYINGRMVEHIMDNGAIISLMDMVNCNGLIMDIAMNMMEVKYILILANMLDSFKMGRNLDMGLLYGVMENDMKVSGRMASNMVKAHLLIAKVLKDRVNGITGVDYIGMKI